MRNPLLRYTIIDRPGQHNHVATWRGRCTYCGHRVGADVRQTREQPWRIPAEIVGRFLAMRAGSAAIELDHTDYGLDRDVAWADTVADESQHQPGDIHIIHHADLGYNYWFQRSDGLLAAGEHYSSEGKAWRAALLERDRQTFQHEQDDYPN